MEYSTLSYGMLNITPNKTPLYNYILMIFLTQFSSLHTELTVCIQNMENKSIKILKSLLLVSSLLLPQMSHLWNALC